MTNKFDVIGLGLSTIDILTPVPHLPKSNEVFEIKGIDIQGGGPVATALAALGKLGIQTAYLGTIAEDGWGNMMVADFANYNVDTSYVNRVSQGQSPVSIILVEENGDRSILYEKSLLPDLEPEKVTEDFIRSARILHLDGSHATAALKAAKIARKSGVLVSLDCGAGEGIWAGIDDLLPYVDILIVARLFASRYTGHQDPLSAGPELLKSGAQLVVITDGENGSWYWDKNQHFYQPAYKINVKDTTGAGDTFHGAYLYAILKSMSPQASLAFASAVAALKCTQPGGRKGIPTYHKVIEFLESMSDKQYRSNDG